MTENKTAQYFVNSAVFPSQFYYFRPFDSLGCWYNNNYVISSEHDWLTRGISVNKLWINKVRAQVELGNRKPISN